MIPLRLGFIPLTDCAPLAVARELGLFEAEGLEVTLSREASWANVRDKVMVGALDGAHMLAPLPLAMSLGAGSEPVAMHAPLSLSLNGSAITIARRHAEAMRALDLEGMAARPITARPLKALIAARAAAGEPLLTLAVVFPYSMHNYALRYWLAEAGIDPDRDVRLVVAPPPRMAARLAAGDIDGFCVGAPWNAVAADEGSGETLAYATDVWRVGPDKVLGVRAAWAAEAPEAQSALLRALIRAAIWADEPANRPELATLLARPDYVGAPEAAIRQALTGVLGDAEGQGSQDFIVFHRYAAGFPWRSHAAWMLSQMLRWGQLPPDTDIAAATEAVYRPDAYRQAAAALGVAFPLVDEKVEGAHPRPWTLDEASAPLTMAPDTFLGGRIFDAAQPRAYAAAFPITRCPG